MATTLVATLIGGAASAAPVNLTRSSPGWTYFYRLGADIQTHDAELRDCILTASSVYPLPNIYVIQPGAGTIASALEAAVSDNLEATRLRSNEENCMVVRGWQVVRVPDGDGEASAHMTQAALAERLTPWVGGPAPHGEIVRRWDNDLAKADTVRSATSGLSLANRSLSLLSLPNDDKFTKDLAAAKASALTTAVPPRSLLPATHLSPDQIDMAPAGSAIVFIKFRGDLGRRGYMGFTRQGPDPHTPAWVDGRPWQLGKPASRPSGAAPGGLVIAVAVPPGRWQLAGFGITPGDTLTTLCLGAPFFEVNAGDVVYAGAFDMDGGVLHLDMSLDPTQIAPPEAPIARSKLRPAKWLNGAVSGCQLYIYDFELPGVGYADGYRWGGAASSASVPSSGSSH